MIAENMETQPVVITAAQGMVFMRLHDGLVMGPQIALGIDHSTGVPREDRQEYYTRIDEPQEEQEE